MISLSTDLLKDLLSLLSLEDLVNMCRTDVRVSNLCTDNFIKSAIQKHTGYTTKPVSLTWKQFLVLITRTPIKPIDVLHGNNKIGDIWITPNMSVIDLVKESMSLYSGTDSDPLIEFWPGLARHVSQIMQFMSKRTNKRIDNPLQPEKSIWDQTHQIRILDNLTKHEYDVCELCSRPMLESLKQATFGLCRQCILNVTQNMDQLPH